jgi:UDP-glucose 4-epimerase
MKNLIIVTGGAGFVGSNLIKSLLKKTNKKIISLDNYSSGNKKNHIRDTRVKYIKTETIDISKHLKYVKKTNSFNFSFWRIFKNLSKF